MRPQMAQITQTIRAWLIRLAGVFGGTRADREFDAELESHLQLHIDDNLRAGMTPHEARRRAVMALGGLEKTREEYRDRRGLPAIDGVVRDVRHAARLLRRNPSFTVVAVLTLALGIGANAALFQLIDAVSLRALPVEAPHELVEIRLSNMENVRGDISVWHAGATNAIWQEIQSRQAAFSGVLAWSSGGVGLSSPDGDPRFASALLVSGDFFNVLGVQPHLGRVLTGADDQRGCSAPAVVVSHAFWQSEFGGDTAVVGRTVTLDRYPYEIAGVTPREFTGLEVGRRFDVALPLCAEALPPGSRSRLDSGVEWFLIVMGRLKPGWTMAQANAHLTTISPAVFEASLPANYPAENISQYRALALEAQPADKGISILRAQYAGSLWLLQATAALVLLVGCANLANLMLARFTARERDVAVRVALGAGRGRLVQMLLVESLLLSIAAAIAGVWLAGALGRFLVASIDARSNSLFLAMPQDWRLLGFTAATTMLTAALLGLIPAWRTTRVQPDAILRAGGRGLTDDGRRLGVRQILVVVQVALSFVLLAGALLFGRTLNNLANQDLGLRPDGVTVAYVNLSRVTIPLESRAAFKRDLLRRLEQTPGVVAVAETNLVPLSGSSSDNEVWAGTPASPHGRSFFMSTSAGYFSAMAVALVAGRSFDDDRDTRESARVAVVNEAFSEKFFGGSNPVGRQFWREALANAPVSSYEIVGMVKNAKYQHLREDARPVVYLPIAQQPPANTFAQLLVRTSLPADAAIPPLKSAIKQHSPEIVPTFQDLGQMVSTALDRDRLVAELSGFFGALAVLLSTLGLYGVMSFAVARRTKEIGICVALGADRAAVAKTILAEAAVLVVVGCIAGAGLALILSRYVSTLVFGLAPHDPVTLIAAALLLSFVAAVASAVPALRASALDPVAALRLD